MVSPKLPVSRLINVQLQITPPGAQAQSLSTMLLAVTDTTIDTVERYRIYESLSAVAADFGTSNRVYQAASVYFSQKPTPRKLMIGRWARSAAAGGLRGKPISSDYTLWNSITTGAFAITIDGNAPVQITGLNFSAAASMDAVAAIINGALTGATCIWRASYSRFELMSTTTGASSSVAFLTAPGSGTDISDNMGCRVSDSGAYVYQGMTAESGSAWVSLFDSTFGQLWYGLAVAANTALTDGQALIFAAAIEGLTNKHMLFLTTQDAATLLPGSNTDLAYTLKSLNYQRTAIQYSSTNEFAMLSAAAKELSVNYNGNNTALTLMYKGEPGVLPDFLNSTQAGALEAKNCNVYVTYDNEVSIFQNAKVSAGYYVDEIHGTDALAVDLQNDLFNKAYTTTTKIPQTDSGVAVFTATAERTCQKYVNAGLLAPGVWNSGGFGILEEGGFLETGYYVYASSVNSQSQSDRTARKCPAVQVAAKLAGAIHTVDVLVTVNQ